LRPWQKAGRDLNEPEVRKITQLAWKEWASAYGKKASPTNHNNTIALLRHVFAIAIEAGVLYSNPAAILKRAAIPGKEIAQLSIHKFNALIAEMRTATGATQSTARVLRQAWRLPECARARQTL